MYFKKRFTRYTFIFFRIFSYWIMIFLFNNNDGKQLIMNLTDQVCHLFQLVNEWENCSISIYLYNKIFMKQ